MQRIIRNDLAQTDAEKKRRQIRVRDTTFGAKLRRVIGNVAVKGCVGACVTSGRGRNQTLIKTLRVMCCCRTRHTTLETQTYTALRQREGRPGAAVAIQPTPQRGRRHQQPAHDAGEGRVVMSNGRKAGVACKEQQRGGVYAYLRHVATTQPGDVRIALI